MKILFLDIDGVMNHLHAITMPPKFHIDHIIHLRKILHFTDVKIVVSSTWRIGRSISELQSIFAINGLDETRVLGATPHTFRGDEGSLIAVYPSREDEIFEWLKRNPEVEKYVVVDDHDMSETFKDRMVATKFETGLTEIHANKIIELLR